MIIGDKITTDVKFARLNKLASVLVMTGGTDQQKLEELIQSVLPARWDMETVILANQTKRSLRSWVKVYYWLGERWRQIGCRKRLTKARRIYTKHATRPVKRIDSQTDESCKNSFKTVSHVNSKRQTSLSMCTRKFILIWNCRCCYLQATGHSQFFQWLNNWVSLVPETQLYKRLCPSHGS